MYELECAVDTVGYFVRKLKIMTKEKQLILFLNQPRVKLIQQSVRVFPMPRTLTAYKNMRYGEDTGPE